MFTEKVEFPDKVIIVIKPIEYLYSNSEEIFEIKAVATRKDIIFSENPLLFIEYPVKVEYVQKNKEYPLDNLYIPKNMFIIQIKTSDKSSIKRHIEHYNLIKSE